jgi:oligoendopeptidase F
MDVNQYRIEFAAYSSELERAHYQYRAGLDAELHVEPIYERYGDLFTRAAIDSLRDAENSVPAYLETERAGLHALWGVGCIGFLDAQAKELTDEGARCESSARVNWEGESLPAHSVTKHIANEPNHARRRELYARWLDAVSACDDLRAARFESFHLSASALGFDSYRALFTEIVGTDYEKLALQAEAFLERTETAYRGALARAVARDLPDVPRGDLQHADYFFFQRSPGLDQFFPAQDLMTTYADAMRNLGIMVGQQKNIHIDDEARPLKHPRAACFRLSPPDDVRLLVAPIGGAYDYMTLFHEVGHAQHFGWSSRELMNRHPEFIYSPDYATTETYAFLLNHLFHDATWLTEHRPNISIEQARSVVRDLTLLTMHTIRRFCAKLRYDLVLHDSSQVRTEQLASTYAAMQTEATGFARSPALYLSDVDDGFYAAAYLRAWIFEAALREHLRTRYGKRWWASRKAGDELIDLWNTSSRYSVEELARLLGLGELSFDLLAETCLDAMSEE